MNKEGYGLLVVKIPKTILVGTLRFWINVENKKKYI